MRNSNLPHSDQHTYFGAGFIGGSVTNQRMSWSVRRRILAILRASCMTLGFKRNGGGVGLLGFGGKVQNACSVGATLGFGLPLLALSMTANAGTCTGGSSGPLGAGVCMTGGQGIEIVGWNNDLVAPNSATSVTTDVSAIAIGNNTQALNVNAIAVGTNAAATGVNALAIGAGALAGVEGVAIGLSAQNEGDGVSIGREAGLGANGQRATYIGALTGNDIVGVEGTAIGYSAGRNIRGNGNAAVGAYAGRDITGSANVAMGQSAGNTVAGSNNVGVGTYAGGTVEGESNVSIGTIAGRDVIGAENIAIGYAAGNGIGSTGAGVNRTIALGRDSLASANDALALGTNAAALKANDVAIGAGATADGNGVGASAVAIGAGANAMQQSVALGTGAIAANQRTAAIGYEAGFGGLVAGTLVGASAGYNAVGGNLAAFGDGAGARSTGNGNTLVGQQAGVAIQGSDNVALGYRAQLSSFSNFSVDRAVGVGSNALASANEAVALGFGAQAANVGAVALGANSVTAAANPTASGTLGGVTYAYAGTAPTSVVSVGGVGAERQITNVAAGRVSAASTDAINGSQLNATNLAIDYATGKLTHYYSVNDGGTQQANYNNDGATGTNSVASGVNASATGDRAYAAGFGAVAAQTDGVAIGTNAQAISGGLVAIGPNALSSAQNTVAIGAGAAATTRLAIAIGGASLSSGNGSVAIGDAAHATGAYAVGLGMVTNATGSQAVAIGHLADATATSTLAAGYDANATADFSTALGRLSNASAASALALGNSASASAISALAIGTSAVASADGAVAIGRNSISSGLDTIAIGTGARATNSVALGTLASAGAGGTALGDGAIATLAGGVALGKNSVEGAANATASGTINGVTYTFAGATPTSVVSVGSVGAERQVTNVAAGRVTATSTDAINGSQLFATNQAIQDVAGGLTHYYSVNDGGVQQANYNNDGATGVNSLAAGVGAQAQGDGSVSLGDGAVASGARDVAIGSLAGLGSASTGGSVFIGLDAGRGQAGGDNTSLGAGSGLFSSGDLNTGVGSTSMRNVIGNRNVSVGNGALQFAQGDGNIAIGDGANLSNGQTAFAYSLAIGYASTAKVNSGVALGAFAVATNVGDVALGANSLTAAANPTASTTIDGTVYTFAGANPTSVVSVGAVGAERQITNVAAGRITATSTDAINGSQLFATNQAIENVATVANAGWNLTTGAVGTGTVIGTTMTNIAPNGTATFTAGNNIAITQNGSELQIALGTDLAGLNSVSINGGPTINVNGITMAAGNTLNMGGNKITNVAAGTADTDGVNVSQLNQAIGSVNLMFSGNSGGVVTRTTGQTLAIQGVGSTAGSYSGNNVRTTTDPATGAVNIEIAESPKFGNVTINDGGTGKITGVTAGTVSATSTDAVNGSQLNAVGTSTASALGGSSSFDPVTGTVTASLTVGNNTYTNVQDALTAVNGTASAGWNVKTSAVGTGTVSGSTTANVSAGSSATFTAGNNIAITQNGTEVQVALNPNLKVDSVAIANGTTIDSTRITMSAGDTLNMGGNTITNLAAGVNPTDAVNLSQLTSGLGNVLNQANTYTDNRINALNFSLEEYNRDANGGTAAAMAMSQVPQAFEPGMGMMGIGVSTWQGEQAIAFGLSKASDNGRIVIKATGTYNTRGKGGAAAGVGFQF